MTQADNTSIYRPLDEARHEIRLFELLPSSDFQDPIHGHLRYAFLEDGPDYEALSYAWGKPAFTETISLNGQPIHITVNLGVALSHLRLTDKSRTLWVDALCINQADLNERSHQVTLMKEIYEHCSEDLLWLGPNPGETIVEQKSLDRGMALLGKLHSRDETTLEGLANKWEEHSRSRRKMFAQVRIRQRMREAAADRDVEDYEIPEHEVDAEMSLIDEETQSRDSGSILTYLLTSSQGSDLGAVLTYPAVWNRIWVMQELSCAPRIRLVAGKSQLSWDTIATFLGDTPYADAFHGPMSHGTIRSVGSHLFGRSQTIHHQRGIMDEIRRGSDRESSLLDVLARFKSARATDPRDKIYGLLGLTTDAHDVRVTYERTAQQVFTDVTTSIINRTGTLDIICQSPWRPFLQSPKGRLSDLPSWVADFLVDRGDVLLFAQRSIFNAGRPSCETPCHVVEETILRTRGVALGRIGPIRQSDYGTPRDERYQQRAKLPLEWMELYTGLGILHDNDDKSRPTRGRRVGTDQPTPTPTGLANEEATYVTGEPAFTAFWRTLLTDCSAYPMKRLTPAEIEAQDALLRDRLRQAMRDPADDDTAGDKYAWDREFGFQNLAHRQVDRMYVDNIKKWTFTMTDNGLYVLVVQPTREGDLVACIDGGKVPVILRPLEQEGRKVYQLITVAYVHGFMDMEATESSELRERLGLKEDVFLLV